MIDQVPTTEHKLAVARGLIRSLEVKIAELKECGAQARARIRELEEWLDTANAKVDRLAKAEARILELEALVSEATKTCDELIDEYSHDNVGAMVGLQEAREVLVRRAVKGGGDARD